MTAAATRPDNTDLDRARLERAGLEGADLDRIRAALEPVRRALVDDARTEAQRLLVAAIDDAEEMVSTAREDVANRVAQAEQANESAARARADLALGHTRRETHRQLLEARESIRRQLVDALHGSALELRSAPRYPDLLEHYSMVARRQLGPDAVLERDPDDRGGIVARSDGRRVDYTLEALADRALETLAEGVMRLWR